MAYDWDDIDEFFCPEDTEKATYNSVEYDCIRMKKEYTSSTAEAGRKRTIKFSLLFKKADFSALPAKGDKLVFDSETYRIKDSEIDSTGKGLILDLGDEYD